MLGIDDTPEIIRYTAPTDCLSSAAVNLIVTYSREQTPTDDTQYDKLVVQYCPTHGSLVNWPWNETFIKFAFDGGENAIADSG